MTEQDLHAGVSRLERAKALEALRVLPLVPGELAGLHTVLPPPGGVTRVAGEEDGAIGRAGHVRGAPCRVTWDPAFRTCPGGSVRPPRFALPPTSCNRHVDT
jgi:hypothetical protein